MADLQGDTRTSTAARLTCVPVDPRKLLEFVCDLVEAGTEETILGIDAVLAGQSPLGVVDAINQETDGVTDLVTNGMPIVGRVLHRDGTLGLECVLVVEESSGLRTAGILSAMVFCTGDVPDVDGIGGGGVLLASTLDGGALCRLDADDTSPAVSQTVARCLGAVSLRPGTPLDGTTFRWSVPEPVAANLRPCAACDVLAPVTLPYVGYEHLQVHLEPEGPGAPAGGACVDAGLSAAVAALWAAGVGTMSGCEGSGNTDLDGYVALGAGGSILLAHLGIEHGVDDQGRLRRRVAGTDTVVIVDGHTLRFRGTDLTDLTAALVRLARSGGI